MWFFAFFLTIIGAVDDSGQALRHAAYQGDLEAVQQLLDSGVPVDSANDYGRTALSMAAGRGHVDVMQVLIEAEADLNSKDRFYGFTPLLAAVNAKQAKAVTLLVESGAGNVGSAVGFAASNDLECLKAVLKTDGLKRKELTTALASIKDADQPEATALLEQAIASLPVPEQEDQEPKAATSRNSQAASEMELNPEELKIYAGTFADSQGTQLVIRVSENQLVMSLADESQTVPLQPSRKDEFRPVGSRSARLQFTRSESTVEQVEWTSDETTVTFRPLSASDQVSSVEFADFAFDRATWPHFRGSLSRGIAGNQNLPEKWNAETGENIAWQTQIDGLGLSCPVVWNDAVYVSTAVPVGKTDDEGSQLRTGLYGDVDPVEEDREYTFQLWRLSLTTGEVLWKVDCNQAKPAVQRHTKSSHANPTPATDGNYIVTSFASEGIYCHSADGDLVWKKDLGFLDSGWFFDRSFQWGFASSPYIFEDTVYLQCDIQDQSFIVALDLSTGEEIWRTNREDIPTWSSPVAYRDPAGHLRVAVNGTREAALYDGLDGRRLWSLSGMSEIVVPTPQVTPGYVLFASGYRPIRPILAIRHDASGELTAQSEQDKEQQDAFAWRLESGGSYLPTPVIAEGYVHVVSNSGILSVYNAINGERESRMRLRSAGSVTGSPVVADGKLYVTSESGKTYVIPLGPDQQPLNTNDLGEAVLTTPAIASGRLLIRGEKHLFAIGR